MDFDLLLSHAIRRPKEFLYTYPDYRLSLIAYLQFRYYLWQYRRGCSVAAITHHKEFYGLDFFVNKHVLIPRPETETLIDAVIEEIKKYGNKEILLIDVGTGSGCIPIAILKTMKQRSNETMKTFTTDISHSALKVAKKNVRTHNVPITFLHGNLLEPITKKIFNLKSSILNLIITANLPYLTAEQFAAEPSIQKEPRSALVADNGGLALYEQLLHQIASLIANFQFPVSAFFEIDPSQSSTITKLINQLLSQAFVEIKTDLAGRDRVVKIVI